MSSKIFVCSPYRAGTPEELEENMGFVFEVCKDLVRHGFFAFAPHIYFTKFLNDDDEAERQLGIALGKRFIEEAAEVHVYYKNGKLSEGMKAEVDYAVSLNKVVTFMPWEKVSVGVEMMVSKQKNKEICQ